MMKIIKSDIVPIYTGFRPTVSEIGAAKKALSILVSIVFWKAP